ncbi:type IV secretory system conjugative DNA transfer family protein [Kamptonema sp. UHCC 0994]|uniref:type IV secretory system conjugative DNA transfer family protein n=1 Tax=Kamptonema sp. UHCC 0994 TaxID=3031329 RepID=UPI0023B9907C|nr:type IV secretory system conjugative DNA transfer family protein [Kamptonema sp. UHCC 0994]MDF0555629.1 type IV secretory system conjugative DNA transfer family protein [Kamptonema sp. UHCC 0994]
MANQLQLGLASPSQLEKTEDRLVYRQVRSFEERFGKPHLYLAYHAAFPLALTPDLLYKIWANFQRDIEDKLLNIPWEAVADVLLSGLCKEVGGEELYEMDLAGRNVLLNELKANPRFGEERLKNLSEFVLEYIQEQIHSDDSNIRDFAQVQKWTALAYTKPDKAARELALALREKLQEQNKAELVRMASVVETLAEPLVGFEPLLVYSRGMGKLARGDNEEAFEKFRELGELGDWIRVAGVRLPLISENSVDKSSGIVSFADRFEPSNIGKNHENIYINLIKKLLNCPYGEEPNVLNSYLYLLDRNLVKTMELYAEYLLNKNEFNAAYLFKNMARCLSYAFDEVDRQKQQKKFASLGTDTAKTLLSNTQSQSSNYSNNRRGRGWRINMRNLLDRLSQAFQYIDSLTTNKDILILGSGESIKSSDKYREMFDYSQTANINEAKSLTNGSYNNGDFWLGKYINFKRGRVTIGKDIWIPNHLLFQGVLIVGPTGAGKTALLLKSVENFVFQGNLVCVDITGELHYKLVAMANKAGAKLVIWGLNNSANSIVWNFLEELEKFGTEKATRKIAEALYGNFDSTDHNSSFYMRDIIWLTAILAIVVEARRQNLINFNPSDLPQLIINRSAIRALLTNLPEADKRWRSELYSYLNIPDDRFGLAITYLQNKLSFLKNPNVKKICDGNSEIFLLQALNGTSRHNIIISPPLGELSSSLAALMINYIMEVMYCRMKNPNYQWIPTYIICDEAPRLKNIDYEELTAISRNAKVGVFLVCQSIDQFSGKAMIALDNCRTQIFLQGVSFKTADWLSKQLGEYNQVPILGIREIAARPYNILPSGFSAIVRMNAARSPFTKPFLTDYSF